jgi:hypothetical protein
VPVHCRMRAFDRDLIRGGHYGQRPVCRANRPNTWLHRPACKREENPCQLGAVHTWHFGEEPIHAENVRHVTSRGCARLRDIMKTWNTPTVIGLPMTTAQ